MVHAALATMLPLKQPSCCDPTRYAMPVDWALLENGQIISKKLQPWISKKVTEVRCKMEFLMSCAPDWIMAVCSTSAMLRSQ